MSEARRVENQVTCKIRHRGFYFAFIFLLAIATRTCAVVTRPQMPVADAADYHQIATRLVEGRGFVNSAGVETAWRPPGYPAFLAAIYSVTGPSIPAATSVQIVIGAITVLLLVMFGAVVVGPREAIVAGFVAAVYSSFVWLPRLLLSENLSLLFTVATLWAVVIFLQTQNIWWLALFGAITAVNTLVRGGNLAFAAFVTVGVCFVMLKNQPRNWRRLITGLVIGLAVFILVLMPWTLRNYRVFHRFVPIATQDGLSLYASYWPPQKNGKLMWGTLPGTEDPNIAAAAQASNEVDASKYLRTITMQRLRADPAHFVRVIPSKMLSLLVPLDWEILPPAPGQTRSLNFGYLLIILPACFGVVVLYKRACPHRWLLWVLPATVVVQAVFFYGSPRFRLPAELIAVLLAGTGLVYGWAFLKNRTSLLP